VKWKHSLTKFAASTVRGLWLALKTQYEASATIGYYYDPYVSLDTSSTVVSLYIRGRNTTSLGTWDVYWVDPMDDMISMLQ
jgi:hypothetical protein